MARTAPTIPFEFVCPSSEEYEQHLAMEKRATDTIVSWAPAGVTITVPTKVDPAMPDFEFSPDRDQIEMANSGLVKFYGDTGYSIGTFHEFLVSMREMPYDGFRLGRIEVTFGQATPLVAYLFDAIYRWKHYGPWSGIHSARIMGANSVLEAELAFSNALIRYNKKHSRVPTLYAMNIDAYLSADEDCPKHEDEVLVDGPAIRDVEPVRFMHRGLLQADAIAACVYFYRVLEFFAFSSMAGEFAKVRHDATVSDEAFPAEVLKLFSRDEKGPLLRLINHLADSALLKSAVQAGLIERDNANLLGERLYAFRNSIVHGKNTYGHDLHSPSIFEELASPRAWRTVLRALAETAIERFGRKLL